MKRNIELILGLIGGILGLLITLSTFISLSFYSHIEMFHAVAWRSNFMGVLLAIAAIGFSCTLKKTPKLSGIMLIICGLGLLLCNVITILPGILLLMAGVICYYRKDPKNYLDD